MSVNCLSIRNACVLEMFYFSSSHNLSARNSLLRAEVESPSFTSQARGSWGFSLCFWLPWGGAALWLLATGEVSERWRKPRLLLPGPLPVRQLGTQVRQEEPWQGGQAGAPTGRSCRRGCSCSWRTWWGWGGAAIEPGLGCRSREDAVFLLNHRKSPNML